MRQSLGLLGLGLPLARCCRPTGFARVMLALNMLCLLASQHFTTLSRPGLNAQIGHQRDGLRLDTSVPTSYTRCTDCHTDFVTLRLLTQGPHLNARVPLAGIFLPDLRPNH